MYCSIELIPVQYILYTSSYRKSDTNYTVLKIAPGSWFEAFKPLQLFLPSLLTSSDIIFTIIRQRKAYAKRHLEEMVIPSPLPYARKGQTKWQHSQLLFTMLKIIFAIALPFIQRTKSVILSILIQTKSIQLLKSQVVVIRGEETMISGYLTAHGYPDGI